MKIYDGVYQGKGIIQALKVTIEGENLYIFIPKDLQKDYLVHAKEKKLLIRNVEKINP